MKKNNKITSSCKKMLAQIARTKDAIQAQFQNLAAEHQHVLHLALNEAEAVAWQTQYPYLVFADLAEEKARGVVNWIARQRALLAA